MGPSATGPAIWVHAASVGEVNAVKSALVHLSRTHKIVVTTVTPTGRTEAQRLGLQDLTVGLAPLDLGWITQWFLRRNDIVALIIVENEFWPARIDACQRSNLPVITLNGRMSQSTMDTWSRFPKTAKRLFGGMTVFFPQDAASAKRFQSLGALPDRVLEPFNLKALYLPVHSEMPSELKHLQREKTLLAAATHEGEDAVAIAAFQQCLHSSPDLKLIIAPRHTNRADAICDLVKTAGLSVARRSIGGTVDANVYVADTLGEMHLWYRLAGAAFIGGSLVPKGGHTPFEPAAYGCAILHGPHIDNFTDGYRDLSEELPIWSVQNADELAAGWLAAMQAKPPIPKQQNGASVFEKLDRYLTDMPRFR